MICFRNSLFHCCNVRLVRRSVRRNEATADFVLIQISRWFSHVSCSRANYLFADCYWYRSQRLSGFHTSCLRKIYRIYWPQKITNKELYQRTGQRDITMVVKQRRWRWHGHVIRKNRDSITRTALRWTPDSGRRKRGRPRETWRRTIEAEMKTAGKTWKELEKAAMEREQWNP